MAPEMQVREISVEEAFQREEVAWFLDVRRRDEYVSSHPVGAESCPRDVLESLVLGKSPSRDQVVFVICAAGERSKWAARNLTALGLSEVYSVRGGFNAWRAAGLPVEVGQVADRSRYERHLSLPDSGAPGQDRLSRASALVVGAGGLGSPAALYLAAAGIGSLGIVDDDRVELSNLQRQILHDETALGWPKVASAARRLRALNKEVSVRPLELRIDDRNVSDVLDGYDIVIDGSDNYATRFLVSDAAFRQRIPYVFGSVYQFEGQVAVFHPHLACFRCFQPSPPTSEASPSCAEAGVLGALTGVIGSLQALQAIMALTATAPAESTRLLHFDALAGRVQHVEVAQDPSCTQAH